MVWLFDAAQWAFSGGGFAPCVAMWSSFEVPVPLSSSLIPEEVQSSTH